MQPVRAVAVSGTLTDDAGPVPQFGVRLMPRAAEDGSGVIDVASTSTDARGRFTFPLVPQGAIASQLVALPRRVSRMARHRLRRPRVFRSCRRMETSGKSPSAIAIFRDRTPAHAWRSGVGPRRVPQQRQPSARRPAEAVFDLHGNDRADIAIPGELHAIGAG